MAHALTQFGADGRAGPVAIVVDISPLSVNMAVLLKQNVEQQTVKVFTRFDEAMAKPDARAIDR